MDEAKTIGAMFRTINEMDGVPEIGGMGGSDGLFCRIGAYADSFFVNGTVPGEIGPPSFGSAYSGGSISLEFVYNDGKWTCSYDGTTSEAKEIEVKPEMGMGVVSGFMGGMKDGGSVKLTEFSAVTSGAAVPEPSSCSVLLSALLFGALRRRR